MTDVVQIVEMDQERDRKTCVAIDHRGNRELAQWLVDHPRYSGAVVAGWLGCGKTRINDLRRWAADGFKGAPHNSEKRQETAAGGRHDGRPPLETHDNSDDGGGSVDEEVAAVKRFMFAVDGVLDAARDATGYIEHVALSDESVADLEKICKAIIVVWKKVETAIKERKRT